MIGRWLRMYLDWKAEKNEPPGLRSRIDRSRLIDGGRPYNGGPAAMHSERNAELATRVATVEAWLAHLSPLERRAVDYWLNEDAAAISDVAAKTGVPHDHARVFVQCIPLLIWGRFYRKGAPVDKRPRARHPPKGRGG